MQTSSAPILGSIVAVLTLSLAARASTDCVFQDQGGIVSFEMESGALTSNWVFETFYTGFTGTGYYRWNGPNLFNSPGTGIIPFQFQVNSGGNWRLSLHNRHQNPDSSLENDVWVRMDGGEWKKVYSNQGAATVDNWNWHSNFDNDPLPNTKAVYSLSPGEHLVEFSGRSKGFMIDRVHLYQEPNANGTNTSFPESSCDSGGPLSYCQGKVSTSGCVARLTTSDPGAQPVSGAGDYRLLLIDAEGRKNGLFFASVSGKATIPFQGGTLCMNPPLARGPVLNTGGGLGQCNGSFGLVINDGDPLPPNGSGLDAGPGGVSLMQAWMRDPQNPDGFGTALSDAIELAWE